MNYNFPDQAPRNESVDEELALLFLTKYHALEQALMRAGFREAGRTPGNGKPDWNRFARHIKGIFQPKASPELMGAVGYLLAEPDKVRLRNERLRDTFPGELYNPESDVVWLTELVQEIGNKVFCWINFMENPGFEDTDIAAALFIIEAWSEIDPRVKGLLKHLQ